MEIFVALCRCKKDTSVVVFLMEYSNSARRILRSYKASRAALVKESKFAARVAKRDIVLEKDVLLAVRILGTCLRNPGNIHIQDMTI